MAKRVGAVRTSRQYAKLTAGQRQAYERTVEARRHMRDGVSLSRAAKQAGTTARTVRLYSGSDLENVGGRVRIRRDRAYRPMVILTNTGFVDVNASRRDASIIGSYWNALNRYRRTTDSRDLARFSGVVSSGYELETDLDAINERDARGEFDEFDEIYAFNR
jgi:hypothetical protein